MAAHAADLLAVLDDAARSRPWSSDTRSAPTSRSPWPRGILTGSRRWCCSTAASRSRATRRRWRTSSSTRWSIRRSSSRGFRSHPSRTHVDQWRAHPAFAARLERRCRGLRRLRRRRRPGPPHAAVSAHGGARRHRRPRARRVHAYGRRPGAGTADVGARPTRPARRAAARPEDALTPFATVHPHARVEDVAGRQPLHAGARRRAGPARVAAAIERRSARRLQPAQIA